MSENPYQTPTVSEVAAPLEPLSDAAQIRQKHLRHEASLKGMGTLLFLGGAFGILIALSVAADLFVGEGGSPQGPELIFVLLFLGLIPVQFFAWWGLRKLKPWSKIPAGIMSGLGLMALGLGTIISIYFLYLLFCAKGRFILSPAYQEIVDQTPGMKYKTPLWNWIVLGVIVLLAIIGVAYAVFATA
jgi:hypothetical protein